jgi:O-6-methylguanine DNA methyltransferase
MRARMARKARPRPSPTTDAAQAALPRAVAPRTRAAVARSVPEPQFALFDTPIGRCAIAWSPAGIKLLQLPEGRESATRARLLERVKGARESTPPAFVQVALRAIERLLAGETADFSELELDLDEVPPFHRRVYEQARRIAPGSTLSYGELAAQLGSPGSARAVGQALGRNPFPIVVPCHRVFAAGGKIGGFTATGGINTKRRLLALETPRSSAALALGDGDAAFGFDPEAALAHLRASDPMLGRLIDAIGPFQMQLQRTPSVFGALAEAIVYQQLSGKAAATIFGRLCGLFRDASAGLTPAQISRASEERLRSAGLSRSKVLSLQDLARKAITGELPSLADVRLLDDETIIERLTAVRGVGRWTAEMLLILRLGRPDVLPVDDYGVRKGFALAFKKKDLPARKDLEQRGERWRPYRSVASRPGTCGARSIRCCPGAPPPRASEPASIGACCLLQLKIRCHDSSRPPEQKRGLRAVRRPWRRGAAQRSPRTGSLALPASAPG